MDKKDFFERYFELRDQIDAVGQALSVQHKGHMQCRKGCDSCCESINVFPLELDAIKYAIENDKIMLPKERRFNKYRKSCNFLMHSACSIYEFRPIICRTQGFPLLYQNASGDAYELSVCHLNFKKHEPNSFNLTNALFMPSFNSQLYLLNQKYVTKHYAKAFTSKSRVPLYKIYL
ncbi:MAG: YkgJ family cysteine cluster protein [Salinivirgaceae bacterium]|jgi:Fe-S-cluster containining protein